MYGSMLFAKLDHTDHANQTLGGQIEKSLGIKILVDC